MALAVVAIAGITLLAIRTSAATDSGGLQIVEERYEGTWGIYNIHRVTLPEDFELERWKYLIRDDDTCSGSTFGNDGKDTEGNLPLRYDEDDEPVYVSYSTDPDIEYIPFNTSSYEEASTFDGKYVCFAVRAQDGRWPVIGTQLDIDWTPRTGGPSDVECPDGHEWLETPDGESGCIAITETLEDEDDPDPHRPAWGEWTDEEALRESETSHYGSGYFTVLKHDTEPDGTRYVVIASRINAQESVAASKIVAREDAFDQARFFLDHRGNDWWYSDLPDDLEIDVQDRSTYFNIFGLEPFDLVVIYEYKGSDDIADYDATDLLFRGGFYEYPWSPAELGQESQN